MTPRRALVMHTFALAYLERLTPAERISFLAEQLLAITDIAYELEVIDAAIAISRHSLSMTPNDFPHPHPGVSP
jgi:hypothetical protein